MKGLKAKTEKTHRNAVIKDEGVGQKKKIRTRETVASSDH